MHDKDHGVSAVLGAFLMLALMATMLPGVILLRAAVSDEMAAQREAAERAAWCARHPDIGPPDCAARGPMPGYACEEVELEVWVCSRAADVTNGSATNTSTHTNGSLLNLTNATALADPNATAPTVGG